MFEGLILDCDGVVIDSEDVYISADLEALSALGLEFTKAQYLTQLSGLSRKDFYASINQTLMSNYAKGLPGEFPDTLRALTKYKLAEVTQPLPGVNKLLELFGKKSAIASSSSSAKLNDKLKNCGLYDSFKPHIYSTERVSRGKPSPDIYQFTAWQISVEPSRCLVIEDSLNGVRAGVAAGMTVFGYTGGSHLLPSFSRELLKAGATHVFNSHVEISGYLKNKKGVRSPEPLLPDVASATTDVEKA